MLASIISSQSETRPLGSLSRPRLRPALLTRMSMGCQASGRPAMAFSTAVWTRTSRAKWWTAVLCSRSSVLASRANRSARRPHIRILAPAAAKARAVASPIPALAPVTKTIFSLTDSMERLLEEILNPRA